MNKFSTFLLGAITGAIALGITACVCETDFSTGSSDEGDETDGDEAQATEQNNLHPDSALIVR